jgi:hypothetical protein
MGTSGLIKKAIKELFWNWILLFNHVTCDHILSFLYQLSKYTNFHFYSFFTRCDHILVELGSSPFCILSISSITNLLYSFENINAKV